MRHRWINAEDRTIARYIVLFDKPEAFRKYAEDFYISEKAVASRYYRRRTYIDSIVDDLNSCDVIPAKRVSPLGKLWMAVKSMLNITRFI